MGQVNGLSPHQLLTLSSEQLYARQQRQAICMPASSLQFLFLAVIFRKDIFKAPITVLHTYNTNPQKVEAGGYKVTTLAWATW